INGEDDTVGSLVRAGLQRDFARRYSDNKCKFKDKWFNKKTVEQARQEKPSKWKAGDAQWQIERRTNTQAEMKAIQDAITAGTIPPKTDRQILAEVTRSTNRYCSREQLEDLKRQHALEKEEQRKAFESQQNALKKFVEFFNRQQSTPSSQFQILDLYTPQVFPGSISTPDGPSSSSPAPSSTPLGLGNCYTSTFDLETSQSGEQEDNGSDDGNHEYGVDIYDDELGIL
nr:hypothetical protein [Tanacetum cinerariifolium]